MSTTDRTPIGEGDLTRTTDVDARQVDESQDRLVRIGAIDERTLDPPGDRPELAVRGRVDVQRGTGRRLVGDKAVEHEEPVGGPGVLGLGERVRIAFVADGVELEAGEQRHRVLEVRVALADEEGARASLGRHDRERPIVRRERIGTGESSLDRRRARRNRADQRLRALAGRNRQLARVDERAIGIDLEPSRRLDGRRIGDGHEDVQLRAARSAQGRQCGDRLVRIGFADALDEHGRPDAHLRQLVVGRVADDDDRRVGVSRRECRRERERIGQVARELGGRDPVDRLERGLAVIGLADEDVGGIGRRDHRHAPALRQPADDVRGSLARQRHPILAVGPGRHRRAGVDDQDDVRGEVRRRRAERARRGEHDERRDEQLHEQQPAESQPLPRRVGLDVADELLPQERRADGVVAPAQPQHVERHDHRQAHEADERERQDHSTTLRRRRTSKRRSASSMSAGTWTYAPPRLLTNEEISACHSASRVR